MKENQIKKWEKIRKKGKKNFVWFRGVIGWGVFTAIFWSIFMQVLSPEENLFLRPLIALIIFPIGGYFWGIWVWNVTERKYLKASGEIA